MRRGIKHSFQPPLQGRDSKVRKTAVEDGVQQRTGAADAVVEQGTLQPLPGRLVTQARRAFNVPAMGCVEGGGEKRGGQGAVKSGDGGTGSLEFYTVLYTKREPNKVGI